MAIAAKSYNPGFLTDDELREMFCVRVDEFESLVETLRENTGESNKHAIVIGPRGSGKTTLLLRVALEVRSDPALSSRLYPIVFAEESYSVATCGEFWLECLSRLSDQVPYRPGEPDLRRTLEDVRKERDDRILRDRCLGALLDFAERQDKRLVLHVENLNMLFSDMMDPDAGWCLRKTLQTEPRIMMIGSATSRFGEIDRPDRALYDLFRVLQLRRLDRKESAALCERVSRKPVDAGVVRRLQILTGGSPRLLAILARFASARSFRTLLADLLDLVDEHTAYFKSHLESLPPQERRVYLALAALWKPATAREVSDRARMETSKCSAQLRRLMGRGVVSDVGGTHRRKEYYLSERLYNIYYLLRRSRGTDNLVAALVQFMDAYYSRSELQEMVDNMVVELGVADPRTRLIYRMALKQLSACPAMGWHLYRRHPGHLPKEVKAATEEASTLLLRSGVKLENGDLHGALAILDELLQLFWTHEAPMVRESVIRAFVNKGIILMRLERREKAILAFEEAVELFRAPGSPALRPVLATALVNKSFLLNGMGRTRDAIAVCDELVATFGFDGADAVAEPVATALFNRAKLLDDLDRTEEALAGYDDLLRRFGSRESAGVLTPVANGQINRAATLVGLQRWDEAIEVCQQVWDRFGNHEAPSVLQPAWKAMTIKSAVLSIQGRVREHLATCQELLDRLDRHSQLAATDKVANHDAQSVSSLRLAIHEIRILTYMKQRDVQAIADDVRTVLRLLPHLEAIQARTIRCLMAAGLPLGLDRLVALIRDSPSSRHLLALTTALELNMGIEPRVAVEIREVAEDLRSDLETIWEQLANEEALST